MSKVLIKSSTLTDIANAIRAKDGSTAQMYPSEMAGKIGAIENIKTSKVKLVYRSSYHNWKAGVIYANQKSVMSPGQTVTIDVPINSLVIVGYTPGSPDGIQLSNDFEIDSKTSNVVSLLQSRYGGVLFYLKDVNPNGDTVDFSEYR